MIRAGGVIFASIKTRKICLTLRSNKVSNSNLWAFVGGKIHKDESILAGISREIREEFGFIPEYKKVIPIDFFKSNDNKFSYYSYIVFVEDEFVPQLNEENSGYGWFNLDGLPKPLHQGAKNILYHPKFKKIFNSIAEDFK